MFAFFEELMDQIDSHEATLFKAHRIVCLYKMDIKPEYKEVKPKLDAALKEIRIAREKNQLQLWPETNRLIGQEVLLMEKEIKDDNYKISDEVLKIHNRVEESILKSLDLNQLVIDETKQLLATWFFSLFRSETDAILKVRE